MARCAALVLVSVLVATASTPVNAQAVCVPDAIGVPGMSGEPPDWSAPGPSATTGHNDPRWNGALGIGHGDGKAHFRALRKDVGGQRYLYLGFRVKIDPEGKDLSGTAGDRLVLGFGKPDGTLAYRLTLRIDTSTATDAGAIRWTDAARWNGKIKVESFEEWRGSWTALEVTAPTTPAPEDRAILPSWLTNDTKLWVTCPGASCATGTSWNVQLRIPLGGPAVDTTAPGFTLTDNSFDGGLELNGDMVAFHRLDAHFTDTSGPVPDDVTPEYVWPEIELVPGTLKSLPEVSEWAAISAGGAASCAGTIGFEGHNQIATGNADPTAITPTTTFHARPRNNSGIDVAPNHLQVRFRIADWGSTLFSSPEWTPVCASDPATTSTVPVASGNELDLSCANVTPFDPCDYIDTGACAGGAAPTHYHHQCILAQLETAPGAPQLLLGREAYWNNMWLRESSVVEETASVSIRGLAALGAGRDVFLYVESLNMPAAPAKQEPSDEPNDPKVRAGKAALVQNGAQPILQPLDPAIAKRYASGSISSDELDAKMPTYRVHVWHATGQTRDGAQVLAAQPSFGFYLYHDGPFDGWRHELSAAGLTEIRPQLYKLHLADDGVAKVRVRVESVERDSDVPPLDVCEDRCQGERWCLFTCSYPMWWLLLLVLLLVVAVAWLRRR